MMTLNETHDVNLTSWLASANVRDSDFPIQNLPFAIFRRRGTTEEYRGGVAIGDAILDLHAALDAFEGEARRAVEATAGGQLNAFFELGRGPRVALRERLLELLAEGSELQNREAHVLHRAAELVGALRHFGVAVRPGGEFGSAGEYHLRLSYAASEEAIAAGVARLAEGFSTLRSQAHQ